MSFHPNSSGCWLAAVHLLPVSAPAVGQKHGYQRTVVQQYARGPDFHGVVLAAGQDPRDPIGSCRRQCICGAVVAHSTMPAELSTAGWQLSQRRPKRRPSSSCMACRNSTTVEGAGLILSVGCCAGRTVQRLRDMLWLSPCIKARYLMHEPGLCMCVHRGALAASRIVSWMLRLQRHPVWSRFTKLRRCKWCGH